MKKSDSHMDKVISTQHPTLLFEDSNLITPIEMWKSNLSFKIEFFQFWKYLHMDLSRFSIIEIKWYSHFWPNLDDTSFNCVKKSSGMSSAISLFMFVIICSSGSLNTDIFVRSFFSCKTIFRKLTHLPVLSVISAEFLLVFTIYFVG